MNQQPFQGVPNMTTQQIQQVQQVIQSYPPEKQQMLQQQVQQLMPQQHVLGQLQVISPPPMLQQTPPTGQPMQQQPTRPAYTTTAPSGLFGSKHSSGHGSGPQDAQKSDSVKRFFGDTLFGRVARSSVQTATSMAKMPTSLSPWGDNNPVTLPNVRYRDAVLFTTFAFVGGPLVDGAADGITSAFGADSFISEIVGSGAGAIAASTVLKYSVFQIVEQAIDKGIIEHMLPEEEKMLQTTNVKSLQVGIKHKLMGVDADVRFVGIYPTRDSQACEKGWFCPYLFASARTPSIPRANDFAIAQSFGPFLGGKCKSHPNLCCIISNHIKRRLSARAQIARRIRPYPRHVRSQSRNRYWHKPYAHLVHWHISLPLSRTFASLLSKTTRLLTPTYISLFLTLQKWSTSRRPGCGTIIFHLLDGCPALVLPVTKSAPIAAWSPWTLSQMRTAAATAQGYNPQTIAGSGGYSPEWQRQSSSLSLSRLFTHLRRNRRANLRIP